MISAADTARLLPWRTADGKPCFLVGEEGGHIARIAEQVECVQLGMAEDLLDHADATLTDGHASPDQLHYVATCLTESLRQVHVIAESRGARLCALGYGVDLEDDEPDVDPDDGEGPTLPAESFG
ncbi:hypothetical protein [Streptomyces formicae]